MKAYFEPVISAEREASSGHESTEGLPSYLVELAIAILGEYQLGGGILGGL
jgi:hypothetical protein